MNLSPLSLLISLAALAVAMTMILADSKTTPESNRRSDDGLANEVVQISEALPDEAFKYHEVLSFDEVFVTPAGPKGLEYTAKIKALDGKKIRITGFMVRHADIDTSAFLFCATPRAYNEREEGLADSIPPNMLYVVMPVRVQDAPAWRREKMTLYGTLELGAHQELSGRVSHLRLRCEAVTEAQTGARLEVRKPIAFQSSRAVAPPGDVGSLPPSDIPTSFFNPRRNHNNNILPNNP